ncbi:MAG: type II secretion system inner membrane protein GspF [Deltaproteobacteria bacterium]|nr:type II secretion system inner membrane protein GspF [Deltaproteobacteria bacterium]RLB91325.1 MAG: type II secretion system protein GspF [Deltaproteobacteria bacterium]RLB96569.1 MAG: type II secretion system protein GspF [Deltaproteobacteria bacterium]RLC09012.1 MAG: type II secretion system protein GspF [Deltaproteobacteria bacterium]
MPVYEYTAIDPSGKNVNGIIDADSAVAARQKLRDSGIFPVGVKQTSTVAVRKGASSARVSVSNLLKRVKAGEISVMTRQLSILLSAGVPLVGALDGLLSQITNPLLKKIIAQIKESVNEGNSLAFALSRHPRIFSNVYINMVRAGEASGSLDLVLERLADLGEHQETLKGRFRAALAYPIFMFFIGSLVLFFLITFIVPNITQIFKEMHQVLPLPTVILIGVSNFLKSFWWILFLIMAAVVMALKQFKKTPKGCYMWDKMKLRIPVFGSMNNKIAVARFGRTLGSLLQSGVPLISALQIVRNIVNNVIIARMIDDAMEEIQAGKSLAGSLAQSPWVPSIVVQMISVGEQSGELEAMLNKVADTYERDVESHVMAMTSMLEPVMILFMGLIVGFIVVSILLPIFEMNQMIH